jgi:ABC-2 type transport system ATP-binding protein
MVVQRIIRGWKIAMKELVCRNLTKNYGKGSTALDGLALSIPSKGIFALIGRNGAGKTTLTRILATELMPTSGSATIDEMDVVKDAGKLRNMIAVLPQEARAVAWLTPKQTVITYLMYRGIGYYEAKDKAHRALEDIGMAKYENTLNEKLSGGQKRKILVATVLASEAPIVFVDEPTTGLDPISRSELWETFKELKKDHFIFLTTHYLEEAEKLADRIGILHNGKLMGMGTLEELRKLVKYQYSIRILQKKTSVKIKEGQKVVGEDGFTQIMTTEKEADALAIRFIKEKIRFAINPISLEDIFYYIVKKPIYEEDGQDTEEEGGW